MQINARPRCGMGQVSHLDGAARCPRVPDHISMVAGMSRENNGVSVRVTLRFLLEQGAGPTRSGSDR